MVLSATVRVFLVNMMAKYNFLARRVGKRFRIAPIYNRQWASFPYTFSEQTFKTLWEPCCTLFAMFVFLKTVLFPNSFRNSLWTIMASSWSRWRKESPDAVLSVALTTLHRAALSVIDPITSIFFAFFTLLFSVFALVIFESTGGRSRSNMERCTIWSIFMAVGQTCFGRGSPSAFRLVAVTTSPVLSRYMKHCYRCLFDSPGFHGKVFLPYKLLNAPFFLTLLAGVVTVWVFKAFCGSMSQVATKRAIMLGIR